MSGILKRWGTGVLRWLSQEQPQGSAREATVPPRLRLVLLFSLLGVTIVAVCVRAPLLGTTYTAPDSGYYLAVAKKVFHAGYSSNLRPPAYPTLLAFLELFGADPASAAVVFQNLIGIVLPAFVLLVGWRFFSPVVGIVAGFLAAASPLVIAIEQFALTDYLFSVVLFVAVVILAEAVLRMRSDRRFLPLLVASGALFGLATLFRANGIYALVAIPIALLLAGPRWKPALRGSAIAAGALVVVIAPWCIYSLIRFDDLNVASEGGLSLYSRAISYDQVQPPAETEYGRIAREIYNTADPNRQEAAVGTTAHVLEAFVRDLGLDQIEATGKMGDIAIEAIIDDPGAYVRDTLQILGRYQGVYYPRTPTGNSNADQVTLATSYVHSLDQRRQSAPGSALIRFPWGLAQALTDLLFILTAGGLLMLALPFLGDRRSRLAATIFLTMGILGIVTVALTARFELRHAVVFAPLIWVLAPATAAAVLKLAVSVFRRPRLRTRHAPS